MKRGAAQAAIDAAAAASHREPTGYTSLPYNPGHLSGTMDNIPSLQPHQQFLSRQFEDPSQQNLGFTSVQMAPPSSLYHSAPHSQSELQTQPQQPQPHQQFFSQQFQDLSQHQLSMQPYAQPFYDESRPQPGFSHPLDVEQGHLLFRAAEPQPQPDEITYPPTLLHQYAAGDKVLGPEGLDGDGDDDGDGRWGAQYDDEELYLPPITFDSPLAATSNLAGSSNAASDTHAMGPDELHNRLESVTHRVSIVSLSGRSNIDISF